jgi:hypothetical protein
MRLTPEEVVELNRYLFNALEQKDFDVKLNNKSGYIKGVSKLGVNSLPGICHSYVDGKQEYSYMCLTAGTVDSSDLGYYCLKEKDCAIVKYSQSNPVKIDIRNYRRIIDAFVKDLDDTYNKYVKGKVKLESKSITRVKIKSTGDVFEGKEGVLEEEKDDTLTVLVNFDDKGRKVRQYFKKENVEYVKSETLLEDVQKEVDVDIEAQNPVFYYPSQEGLIKKPDYYTHVPSEERKILLDETKYIKESFTKIVVEDGTFFIPGLAFDMFINVKDVILPDSLESIGESAFANCYGLESIIIPKNVERIGLRTFANCASLYSVTVPNKVKTIDNQAFLNCVSLKSIELPPSLKYLHDYAFEGCFNLKTIKWKGKEYSKPDFWGMWEDKNETLNEENNEEVDLEVIPITDEKILALSNVLEIDPSLIVKNDDLTGSSSSSEYGKNLYVVINEDQAEYLVIDSNKARDMAYNSARDFYESGDANLNEYTDYIDTDSLRDIWEDSERDRIDYEDDFEVFENAVNEGILSEDDFEKTEDGKPDYEKPKEYIDSDDIREKLLEARLKNYSSPMEWLEETYGRRELSTFLADNNLFDFDAITEDDISNNGYGNWIAHYDQREIDLDLKTEDGLSIYAYRVN